MAVAVYVDNEKGATEVTLVARSSKEVCFVSSATKGAVPVKVVGAAVKGAIPVVAVSPKFVVAGETLA